MSDRHESYARERLLFLATHLWCEPRFDGCRGAAGQVHHLVPRGRAPWLIDDRRVFVAICDPCHEAITRHRIPEADAWLLDPFRFPAYERIGGGIVRLAGVPDPEGLVTEGFAVAMGPGWVALDGTWDITYRNGDQRDARLANIVVSPVSR